MFESVYEECGFLELIAGTDVKVWRKLFLKNGDSECYIIIKSCYIVIIFSFLFVVKEMTDLLYLFKILISDKKAQKYREFQPYWDKIFLPQAAEMPCIFKCFLYHLIYNANHDSETYFIILRFCLWQNFIFIFHQPCPA